MPKGCDGKSIDELHRLFNDAVASEHRRIGEALEPTRLRNLVQAEHDRLVKALDSLGDEWKKLIPGRPILHAFAKEAKLDQARLKTLYIKMAKEGAGDPFAEIREVFASYANFGKVPMGGRS
jgi:hypothetical protein